MRTTKFPRLFRSEWAAMSQDERTTYVNLAKAERAEAAELRKAALGQPRALVYNRSFNHVWKWQVQQRSMLTGAALYTLNDSATDLVVRTRNGVTNPKWKQQIASGVSATTPYTAQSCEVENAMGSVTLWHTSAGIPRRSTFVGALLRGASAGTSGDLAKAEQAARVKFYKKLKKTQQEFGGANFLGELSQTAALIRRPYVAIPKLIDDYVNRAKELIKTPKRKMTFSQKERKLSDAWLTASFGLLPLASDIASAAEAFASLLNQRRQVRVIGFGSDRTSSNTVYDRLYNPYGGAQLYVRTHEHREGEASVRYLAGVNVRSVGLDVSSYLDITRRFGVSVNDYVPMLYEIMPWSFMIDYFTSLGDVINAWSVSYADVAWQQKTVRHYNTLVMTGAPNLEKTKAATSGYQLCIGYPGTCKTWKKTVIRSDPGIVPLPQLEARMNLSPWKVMNIAALRQQMANYAKKFL